MNRSRNAAFTLVEIMIVVGIIGLLAAMAMQTFGSATKVSRTAVLANDFRLYRDAFEVTYLENGYWPEDAARGVVPGGMEDALRGFTEPSVVEGNWDWDYNTMNVVAGVSLVGSNASDEIMQEVDRLIDDGNLSTGLFFKNGDRFTLQLQ